MKTIVKKLIRDEKGQAMVLVLILLIVGGLIVAPLLAHMGTGLIGGEVYERRAAELYAADAGVEDAVWKIQHQVDEVKGLTQCYQDWSYNVTDINGKIVEVNGKRVEVTITLMTIWDDLPFDYCIESRAIGDGSGTKIDAYIAGNITYCSMLDHLITVQENLDENGIAALERDLEKLDIPCPTGCTECDICGQAYDYDSDAYSDIPKECKGCIAVYNFPDTGWPAVSDLSARYLKDVENAPHWASTIIDLEEGDMQLGPLHVGGMLEIKNSDNKNARTFTLNGTLYITGHTEIGMSGSGGKPNLTVELNGNTIFVASNSTGGGHEALKIGDWCTINGPGAIIAVGDIYFKPNGTAGANEEPAFVLSVLGMTTIQPGVNFLGAIAGKVDVDLSSGGQANVNYPTGGFEEVNFPTLFEAYRTYSIASWEVSQL